MALGEAKMWEISISIRLLSLWVEKNSAGEKKKKKRMFALGVVLLVPDEVLKAG